MNHQTSLTTLKRGTLASYYHINVVAIVSPQYRLQYSWQTLLALRDDTCPLPLYLIVLKIATVHLEGTFKTPFNEKE